MLKPDKTIYQNGIANNEYIITKHNDYCAALPQIQVSPYSISIYSFPDVPIKSYISLAEFYSRQVYYNNFKGLIPHYFVDAISIWKLLEDNMVSSFNKGIVVVICGSSQKAKIRAVDLVCRILKNHDLGLQNVNIVNNSNPMFFDLLEEKVNKLGLPSFKMDNVEDEPIIENIDKAAHCSFEVYFNHQWQQPIKGTPIQAIRLKVSEGELFYRTHLINGGWLPWVEQSEMSGSEASYIDGFQIKYISDKYKLLYRFSIINSKFISWKVDNIAIPTKHYLDNFDFKIEEI